MRRGPLTWRPCPAPPHEVASLPACACGVRQTWDGGSTELVVAARSLLLQVGLQVV